jgi:membrane protein DedA with SNARE-associated domain
MADLIDKLVEVVSHIVSQLGYWGIFFGMMLESACIPIPSEAILPAGGMMVASKTVTMFGTVTMLGANIAVNLGSMIGSILAYTVGHKGGRPFILKYGKYFFVSEDHFYKAEKVFNKYGAAAVFFGRLLPVIRTFISLPAGIAKMDIKKFITFSLVGMIPWNALLIYLGYYFGKDYKEKISPYFHKYEYFVIGAFIMIIVALFARHFFNRRKKAAV